MHIHVIIATHDRWDLLRGTLRSLAKQTYSDYSVHILVDGNQRNIPIWLMRADQDIHTPLEIQTTSDRVDVVAAYGILTTQLESGSILNATDDLIFHPECLSAAVYGMTSHFPRSMGVVGINQLQNGSPKGRKYAFTLMNRRYIDRFPDGIVFCPDYIHYCSDMEHGIFAQTNHCFFFSRSAMVDHIRVQDMTTQLGMAEYKSDRAIYRIRKNRGFLWGQNFDLIRDEI